ncbi:folylpolyglutamate synthase [Exophiala dermatitidis]|uniref:Folylpolyglutamate synthase n=2 Tax=Exophiala dermatitidis TaxID=5970 RepID=H6BV34_EXODN|nr:folylpolyglutamate synthase [Exophiala dermatitidis NIH/UT8656]KAJ4511527.1 folylpolyglutamate synthase [Exophiala dermatitidis]EHY55817.1 folylpolyglutamate synthase [Exophiala dermatitidis NIH/UT8656]KAJ4514296.1 folylpolyglutamate synthase [Exophiala dermatitidis]KAJ4515220.1 folylpolyglutamate synthase [Exophiala dermatitidis]KAJ4535376.1 folylpolyglutamate synthase [Exophiala dermatitidis]
MITLGLQRISRLLAPLFAKYPAGLPWKAIHITGTNGKGSVAALISTFLSASGYRVGRFTSPHLIDRWDCITLDQKVVDRDVFLAAEERVQKRSLSQSQSQAGSSDATTTDDKPSEFEILTATAFELFTSQGMDVAVVECGLGGRLDATNVLRPQDVLVSVLTKVGLDHTDFLGETIERITEEKAGIFKPGVPVVVDESNAENVLDVVRRKVREKEVHRQQGQQQRDDGDGAGIPGVKSETTTVDDDESGIFVLPETLRAQLLHDRRVAQLGLAAHQVQNLVAAFTAYYVAEERLLKLKTGTDTAASEPESASTPPTTRESNPTTPETTGLNTTTTTTRASTTTSPPSTVSIPAESRSSPSKLLSKQIITTTQNLPHLISAAQSSLPGRLQWIELPISRGDATDTTANNTFKILLDGAHNPQSAQALAEYIDSHVRRNESSTPTNPSSSNPIPKPNPLTWILAAKSDKDIRSILSILLANGPSDTVVTCSFGPVAGMPWVKSMDASELAKLVSDFITDGNVVVAESVGDAVQKAVEIAARGNESESGQNEDQEQRVESQRVESQRVESQSTTLGLQKTSTTGTVCIAGSLYLVGDVLRWLRDEHIQ